MGDFVKVTKEQVEKMVEVFKREYMYSKYDNIELKKGMIFYDKKETKCRIVDLSKVDKVGIQYFDHRKKEYGEKIYYWHSRVVKMRVKDKVKHSPLYKVLNE